jgi:branched-subunit amino acid ABC-type transport system permease component
MSVGLTLTLAVMKLPNFAHSELITIGAYAFTVLVDFFSFSVVTAFVVAVVFGIFFALAGELFVFSPLKSRKASLYILILASFAFGLIIRYAIYIWAAEYNMLFLSNLIPNNILFSIAGFPITTLLVWVIPVTFAITLLVHLLLNNTLIGKSMRAMESNFELARISGINTKRVTMITWGIVGALTSLGGAFWSIQTQVYPDTGLAVLLDVFAIVVLAGLTSFYGTLIGAYIISFSENLLMGWLNSTFGISLAYQPIIPFLVIIAILITRPSGLQSPDSNSWKNVMGFLKNIMRRQRE